MEDSTLLGVGPALKAGSVVRQVDWVEQEHNQGLAEPVLGFQFVTETGLDRPKGAVRDLIRSQARRKRPRVNHKSLSKRVTRLLLPSNKLDKIEDPSAAPGSLGHLILREATPGVVDRGPTSSWFDPFNMLPIETHGHSHYLISQYDLIFYPFDNQHNQYLPRRSFSKEDILHFAMSDAAILHATLSFVAKSLCNLAGANLNLDSAYHYCQAISLVNKRIANCHLEAVTNATIFAVGCLAHSEFTTRSIASLKMHLDGLESLVKSRGGIQALASDHLTLKFTYWVDNACSLAIGSKPRFSLVNSTPDSGPADLEPCTISDLRYKVRLSNLTCLQDLAEETIEVYRILRFLLVQRHRTSSSQNMVITKEDFECYSDRLMHRLIGIVQYKFPESPNQNTLIYGLFGNAALAHASIFSFTCNPIKHGSLSELMSMRIRAILETLNLQSFQIAYPEMILWIIMVGGLASTTTDGRVWFAKLLAESSLAAGVNRVTELALFLTDFLWSGYYLAPASKEFWDDFAVAQKVMVAGNELGEDR